MFSKISFNNRFSGYAILFVGMMLLLCEAAAMAQEDRLGSKTFTDLAECPEFPYLGGDVPGRIDSFELLRLYDDIIGGTEEAETLFCFQKQWYTIATETPTPTPTVPPSSFDIENYFPLEANSSWYLVGMPDEGGSSEDNFTWSYSGTREMGDTPVTVTILETTTDEPTDDRNGDQDFFFIDSQGDLYYHGLRNGSEYEIGSGIIEVDIPTQDIIIDPPLKIGSRGMSMGESFESSGDATIDTDIGDIDVTIIVEVEYDRIDPQVEVPLGTFTDVLHLTISLGTEILDIDFTLKDNEFWLKENVGLIKQDQDADESDADVQGLQSGRVGGVPIVAE